MIHLSFESSLLGFFEYTAAMLYALTNCRSDIRT